MMAETSVKMSGVRIMYILTSCDPNTRVFQYFLRIGSTSNKETEKRELRAWLCVQCLHVIWMKDFFALAFFAIFFLVIVGCLLK